MRGIKELLKLFGNKRNKTIDFQIMDRGVGVAGLLILSVWFHISRTKNLILINRIIFVKDFSTTNPISLFVLV
jgi:hypothetical protein